MDKVIKFVKQVIYVITIPIQIVVIIGVYLYVGVLDELKSNKPQPTRGYKRKMY